MLLQFENDDKMQSCYEFKERGHSGTPKISTFGPDPGGRYGAHKWSQIDFLSKYMIFEIF